MAKREFPIPARSSSRADTPLLDALRSTGVTFFTGVPDSEFVTLVRELETSAGSAEYAPAPREDGALALAVGAALAGHRPLLYMESAGIGNAIDALTSLVIAYEIPLTIMVAWAGYKGCDAPHNNVMGKSLPGILAALDLPVVHLDSMAEAPEVWARAVERAMLAAAKARRPGVVLGVPAEFAAHEGGQA